MSSNLYLSADHISVSFGDRKLFDLERLRIYEGDRIGLVGSNGSGKTTLLRLLSGKLQPDEGSIKRFCTPFFFQQFADSAESEAAPEALSRFGVIALQGQDTVSGGEAERLRLAELFSTDRAFLLLDEPTGNLDQDGIRLLDERLESVQTLVLVSHDRMLLNHQCSRILEIERGVITEYDGNYDDYVFRKQQAKARAMTEYEQYTEEINRLKNVYQKKKEKARQLSRKPHGMSGSEAKVREFSASHRSPASKSRMLERSARNILQRMDHMEVKERPRELPVIRPDFQLTDPPQNRIILQAEHLSFAYPNGRVIFEDTSFRLFRGSRTALLGPNGAGKTTLFRLIRQGEMIRSVPRARLGFFHQDLSGLKEDETVLESVMRESIQKEDVARSILARLLFTARDIHKPVRVLSGGEKIRLCFARLFTGAANVLILDEPTNYLDIPSAEALEKLFSEYEGTMLFASHDEAFVNAAATERLVISNRKIRPL
ncbi:MAG: ABC-F family ATP-binding cassette domain-containing protein [Clostridia bacterium]|nr:ABC-F family ATP-binding cassette domain-containing protein [Clostridia bacterium]